MYVCPNCTGNLKFDIPSQRLLCDYCEYSVDPYEFEKKQDAEEAPDPERDYEITMFICPQCGGRILSNDTTAATFCSYCGGATILDSRISREKRPDLIIPFTKTKEDCKDAYVKMMRKSLFVPSDLKKEECISRFRSIYMPYWVYTAEKDTQVAFDAIKRNNTENKKITQIYKATSNVIAKYKGLAFDASSSFPDSLSNAIAPFDYRNTKLFSPSFLSGFYADIPDVEARLYEDDVRDIVSEELCYDMETDPYCRGYELDMDLHRIMRPEKVESQMAMFPVWFMAYRYKNRVGYAIVNGQTGKAAGNIPADKKKYLRASLLLAIPLFLIFNLFLTLSPAVLMLLTGMLALIFGIVSLRQKINLIAKEDYVDDKGSGRYRVFGNTRAVVRKPRILRLDKMILATIPIVAGIGICVFQTVMEASGMEVRSETTEALFILVLIIGFSTVVKPMRARNPFGGEQYNVPLEARHFMSSVFKPGLAVLLMLILLLLPGVSDLVRYGGVIVAMLLMVWNAFDLIDSYNHLTTRPLPQFEKRGGEEDGR